MTKMVLEEVFDILSKKNDLMYDLRRLLDYKWYDKSSRIIDESFEFDKRIGMRVASQEEQMTELKKIIQIKNEEIINLKGYIGARDLKIDELTGKLDSLHSGWNLLGKTKSKILHLFLHSEKMRKSTLKEISEHLKISRSVLQKHLNSLKQDGHIQRIGAKNNGEWVLIKR